MYVVIVDRTLHVYVCMVSVRGVRCDTVCVCEVYVCDTVCVCVCVCVDRIQYVCVYGECVCSKMLGHFCFQFSFGIPSLIYSVKSS
jgi:hypothetical protein